MPGRPAAQHGERADPPRSVLMVLYHFPPIGGVSMSRNVSHIGYLPDHGWRPVVLAPRAGGELIDVESVALVPATVRVVRATCPEPGQLAPLVTLLRAVARGVGRAAGRREREPGRPGTRERSEPDQAAGAGRGETSRPSRVSRLRRLVFFPDNQVAWLPFAVAAAVRVRGIDAYDVVYSSSSPVTSHLVAGMVKRLTGVAWVAEFRDPWVGNPIAEPLPWLHRRVRARLERWVARSADRMVFLSPSTMALYRHRYPKAREMVLITNGHDRSEVPAPVAGGASHRRYRIVWTGTLYRPTELRMFLQAIRNLADRRPTLGDELEVLFYGEVEASCRAVAGQFMAEEPLGSIVQLAGFVPRQAALRAVAESDAALLMLGAGPGMGQFVPGKLFDYLGQSKQVLAVLPPGDAREILRELDWGVIADPDPAAIEQALERLLTTPPPARLADPDGRYDRTRLAGRLADTFRGAVEDGPGARAHRSASQRSRRIT